MPRRRSTALTNGRLKAVATALRSAGPAVGVVSEQLKPLPLDVAGAGGNFLHLLAPFFSLAARFYLVPPCFLAHFRCENTGIAQSKLDEIAAEKAKALAASDFRLASEMHDLHTVLSNAEPGDRAVYASYPDPRTSTVEEQAAFFYRFGFCVLPEVWSGEQLGSNYTSCPHHFFATMFLERLLALLGLRAAWRRRQRPAIEKRNLTFMESNPGLDRRQDSTFVDIPTDELFGGLIEQLSAGEHPEDAVLLDLIDPPRLNALLTRLFVTDEWTELRMPGLLQSRTYPARDDPGGDGRGYIGKSPPPPHNSISSRGVSERLLAVPGWHRDHDGPGLGVSANPAAVIKVFTYLLRPTS